jgi:hypothetical protein
MNRVFFFIFFILKFWRKLVEFQQERKKIQKKNPNSLSKNSKTSPEKEHWLQSPLDSS